MSKFEDYFNKEFLHLKEKEETHIKELPHGAMMMVSGDFYGIQKFIFEGLATSSASKVLRAKSAFVQIFTKVVTEYICNKLKIDKKYIITTNAGKFEILSPNVDENILYEIKSNLDDYFIKNFYGLSGINVSSIICQRDDFANKDSYRNLRKKITDTLEVKKFYKFDLQKRDAVLNYDTGIDNHSLCKICNIRKIKDDNCAICSMFVELGKWLVSDKKSVHSKKDLLIELDGFETEIALDAKIKSYILKGEHNAPQTFEILAKNSCKDMNTGLEALGILKADVDGMGNFIKNSSVTDSFENFELFSKTLDNFFSLYIPKQMQEKYQDSYTVFAGGDDLFLVGSWDTILKLARFIEEEFKRFVNSKELTISFGIAIAKPSTPISYLAEYTEYLLEEAKALDGKDAISLFGETVKWDSYKKVFNILEAEFSKLGNEDINTAFFYRLLEFCEMSKKVKQGDIEATMWKSKLRYSYSRNNTKLGESFFGVLDSKIDNNPEETKMFLSELIYKRRS